MTENQRRPSGDGLRMLLEAQPDVETYRSNLKKLGIENVPELVKFAVKRGLTPLE